MNSHRLLLRLLWLPHLLLVPLCTQRWWDLTHVQHLEEGAAVEAIVHAWNDRSSGEDDNADLRVRSCL